MDTIAGIDTVAVMLAEPVHLAESLDWVGLIGMLASSVAAIGAIGAVFYAARNSNAALKSVNAMQTHQRLSLRPVLEFTHHVDWNKEVFGIELVNRGLGPALIKQIRILTNSKSIDTNKHDYMNAVVEGSVFQTGNFTFSGCSFPPETCFDAGRKDFVISLAEPSRFNKRELKEVAEFLDQLDITIDYESCYGERFSARSINVRRPAIDTRQTVEAKELRTGVA